MGKKRAKYKSPSPIDDSNSDFPPLGSITPLIKYTTRSSLAAVSGGDADNVAGPSTTGIGLSQSQNNCGQESSSHGADMIEVEGTSYPSYYVKICWN